MSKGTLNRLPRGNATHRFPRIVTLAVTSCLLVTMITVDASASNSGRGTFATNRLNLESTLVTAPSSAPVTSNPSKSYMGTFAPTTTTTSTTTAGRTTTSTARYRLDLGLEVKSGLWEVAPVKSVESAIGYKVNIVMGYIGWSYPASESSASQFPTAQLEALSSDGYMPEIVWEPWNGSSGLIQPNYSLASIIDGAHDSYIRSWAEAAKAYGKPLLIRFAEEMNGNWYPWSEQVNGNSPGEYVQAWRHVHNIFALNGVTNVKWVWSPNVVGSGSGASASGASSDLAELYPGNAYVDYVGIDGYSYPIDGCPAASELFDPTLAITSQLSNRLTMIAETGIDSTCSSQTSLMASLLNWASANPRIVALTFFDQDIASANYSLTSSLERTMHAIVTPVTMRSDNLDGLQS